MEDRALWLAYETAGSEVEKLRITGLIVERHIGFVRSYAQRTCFPYWSEAVVEEYVQELVLEALRRIDGYRRHHRGHEGRLATFPTYLKPYLQPVRWAIAGREAPLPVGRETRRMRADAQRFIREYQQHHAGEDPPWEDVAAAVSRAHGKKVSAARIQRIAKPPSVVSGDDTGPDGVGARWEREAPDVTSFEDAIVDADERAEMVAAVQAAVLAETVTPLERAIVHLRLMAPRREVIAGEVRSPGPLTHRELSQRHGVTPAEVARVERSLSERLRGRLKF